MFEDRAEAAFSRAAALVEPGMYVLSNWALIPENEFIPDLAELRDKIKKGAAAAKYLAQLGPLAVAGRCLRHHRDISDSVHRRF